MREDIRWLGFDWGEHLYHASDYFEALYRYALVLVDKGLAYVDSSSEAEIRERRGNVTIPGTNSPFRDRAVSENRDLFQRMRAGEFPDGAHVLRAKIDMGHRNMVMRDPLLYRIRHIEPLSPGGRLADLPDVRLRALSVGLAGAGHALAVHARIPRTIARSTTGCWSTSTRPRPGPSRPSSRPWCSTTSSPASERLKALVQEGHVRGWDDPRMPTLAGLRRRGVTPEAIRALCDMVGVARAQSQGGRGQVPSTRSATT